jgi:hypothetical protein
MTDYTVVTAVDVVALASATATCNPITVKVEGSDSDWATDAIVTICSACEDLDGYKVTAVQAAAFTAKAGAANTITLMEGGCLATATTASAVCLTGKYIVNGSSSWDLTTIATGWATTTVFAAAVSATAPTAYIATTAVT